MLSIINNLIYTDRDSALRGYNFFLSIFLQVVRAITKTKILSNKRNYLKQRNELRRVKVKKLVLQGMLIKQNMIH